MTEQSQPRVGPRPTNHAASKHWVVGPSATRGAFTLDAVAASVERRFSADDSPGPVSTALHGAAQNSGRICDTRTGLAVGSIR